MKPQTQAADGLINEMENDGTLKAELNGNDLVLSKQRRRAMFFEKVGGGKEIPFGKTLVLYRKHNGEDYFTTGLLTAQIKTVNGFKYEFSDDTLREVDTPQSFEYYLVPVVS